MALDLRDCNIAQTSVKAIRSLPPSLREVNLTGNPLLSELPLWVPTDDLWRLVRHLPQLHFVGVPCNNREDPSACPAGELPRSENRASFGLHLALNRARSRVLLNQRVPLSAWSLVLEAATLAFQDDDAIDGYQNTPWGGAPSELDGIFHLLRERGAADIFSA
jgi:hypothetical protein